MTAVPQALADARSSIDNLDAALVHLLAERFKITQRVGELKARLDLPPADPAREAEQVRRLRTLAEASQLDPEFAEKVITFIMTEVVRHHVQIRDGVSPVEDGNVGGSR
ncbi:MAG: chorismate mutase [Propionibacteriaceae bacterium]|jgi:chorismate mutase|nr:chorismate mutase [Propionibacteriaceae bacterium]